jgi:hypothetical protein
VRRAQRGGRLRLLLEPSQHSLRIGAGAGAEQLRPDQLDRGVAREKAMARAPDLAHPPASQQLDELVAAHLLRAPQPPAHTLQDVRR